MAPDNDAALSGKASDQVFCGSSAPHTPTGASPRTLHVDERKTAASGNRQRTLRLASDSYPNTF
jgi:hypothetical protein